MSKPKFVLSKVHYRQAQKMGGVHRDKIKSAALRLVAISRGVFHWFNKPRVIKIKKWKIIIGLYVLYTLIPHPAHPIYAEPQLDLPKPIAAVSQIQPVSEPLQQELESIYVHNAPSQGASGYQPGQCVWGVASWIAVPQNLGNANSWAVRAAAEGYTVSSIPLPGAVGVSTAGYYGHVVLIEAVNSGQVEIKEMNYYGPYVTDERWVSRNDFTYVYFGNL